MDVYDFSERDDQLNIQNKITKHKKRKIKENPSTNKVRPLNRKNRTKKPKVIHIDGQSESSSEFNPPLKLKLIRNQSDPKTFKSIQIINDFSQASDYYLNFNQQSLSKCKLFDFREFAVNDIVWAKISGYPFWPSKILSINRSQKSAQQTNNNNNCKSAINDEFIACVEWLAYDQISYVNCANLSHFNVDFDNKYSTKIKNKKYFEAVTEAKQLTEENLARLKLLSSNETLIGSLKPVDSVHSCETLEGETSSTLPSHTFTSPESNQSLQSCCLSRPTGILSDPLSNQSDRSSHSNMEFPHTSDSQLLSLSHSNPFTKSSKPEPDNNNKPAAANAATNNWDLPDLGSNLDFESNNHIPEFSDYEDDFESIDMEKIKFLVDVENH